MRNVFEYILNRSHKTDNRSDYTRNETEKHKVQGKGQKLSICAIESRLYTARRKTNGKEKYPFDFIMKPYRCLWSNVYQTESSVCSFAESEICIAVDGSEYFRADMAYTHTYLMKYTWIPDVMHVTSRHAISVHLISRKSNSIISNPHTAVFARSRALTAAMIRLFSTNETVHCTPTFFHLTRFSVFLFLVNLIKFSYPYCRTGARTLFPFCICISFSFTLWAVTKKVYETSMLPFGWWHV